MDTYSTLDIERDLGIPRVRLREWTVRGFISPSHPSPGQGKKAEFSRWDVYCVALFKELVEIGFSRKLAGNFISSFFKRMEGSPVISYILFRFQDGKIESMNIGEGSWAMEISSGGIGQFAPEVDFPFRPVNIPQIMKKGGDKGGGVEDWSQIHLVNFKKIKADVDLKLDK